MKKEQWFLAVIMLLAFILVSGCSKTTTAPGADRQPSAVTVVDAGGKTVKLPLTVERVADTWGAHNEIITALGAGDKLVATTLTAQVRPWLYRVNPHMKQAVTAFSIDAGDVNPEELIKTKPDVVFSTNSKGSDKIAELGIPVIQVGFRDFNSLKDCVRLTGAVLGGDAPANAEKYIAYLDEKIQWISGRTAAVPLEKKPRVLHLASLSPLAVDGKGAMVSAGIEIAGGINVADTEGNGGRQVSLEQIIAWNPDVIIIGRVLSGSGLANNAQVSGTDPRDILDNPLWQKIAAVQQKRVYVNPDGAFSWDRYSAEEALQVQWMAKLLYPDLFSDLDMVAETRYFFQTFMKYDLSIEEAQLMLAGKPPAP